VRGSDLVEPVVFRAAGPSQAAVLGMPWTAASGIHIGALRDTQNEGVLELVSGTGVSRTGLSVSCEAVLACGHASGLFEGLDR
jgi:hypothetical protein